MKGLKKLALAAAVVAPFAHAEMTSIDDAMMSEMTGQAGVSIDVNLAMTIDEIRYVDSDGATAAQGDQGYVTLSSVAVGEIDRTAGTLSAASITGITVDVDATQGLVINFGQIGGGYAAGADATAAVTAGNFWKGIDVTADFGINGNSVGTFEIDNFTNYVPNAMVFEGATKFGILANWMDSTNAIDSAAFTTAYGTALSGTYAPLVAGGAITMAQAEAAAKRDAAVAQADAFTAGAKVNAWVAVNGGGSDGAQGLTINASMGGLIQRMAFIDDGNEMGIHNFAMFDVDGSGNIVGIQVTGMTIDVVSHAAAASGQALKIVPGTIKGTFAMGDIYIGDNVNGSLGGLAIKNINLDNTEVFIYGH